MDILNLLPEYIEYLRHERRLSESTLTAYVSDLRQLARFLNREVGDISRDDVRSFMRDLSRRGLSTTTIRRRVHGFSTFWNWLMLTNRADENIAKLITLPKQQRKVPDWLDATELERWVNTPAPGSTWKIRHRNMTAWRTLAWLGLRRSELLKLQIEHVRLEDREVIIRNPKGGKDRVMPLPERLVADVVKQIGDRTGSEYLFASQAGKRWGKEYFYQAFHAHVVACGLADREITPHTLRHTFATQLIREGVDLSTVSRLLGHKDIKTTMIYIQHDPQVLRAAMDKHILNKIETPGTAGGLSRSDL